MQGNVLITLHFKGLLEMGTSDLGVRDWLQPVRKHRGTGSIVCSRDPTHSARLHFLSQTVGGAWDPVLKSLSLWGQVRELKQSGKEEQQTEKSRSEETMGRRWKRRGFILITCLDAG